MGVADKRSVRAPSSPPLRTGSGSSTLINFFARFVVWYLLYTVLFRCPEVPTNDSPTICHTVNTVSTTLRPHLEPYYNQYVEPYVSEYAPYVKKANEEYLVPAYDKATHSYEQYAAPHVSRSKDYVTKGYNRAVKPRVDEVSSKAKVYYNEYLSSHVAKGEKIYTTAQPHLSKAQKTIEEAFKDILIPAYAKVLPYVIKAYEQIWHVVVTIVAPMVKQNGEKAVYWGVGIWSDVVRPQVGRIGERLGGTGNGAPAASVPGSIFSSLSATDASKATAVSSSLASIISSASAEAASAKSSASSSAASKAEVGGQNTGADDAKKLTPEEVQAIIEEDLTSWTKKFKDSQAKTIDDLNAEINKVSDEARAKKASYVEKEIAALENLVDAEFKKIKETTIKITSRLSPESNAEEKQAALDSLFAATKDAGIKIRDKAQEQRLESQKYLAKIYDDVAGAADNNLEIFDSVLDLSMQELGMKWAWMDHVSYKAWRRYHAMKKDFDGLKRDVVTAAQRNKKLIEVTRWVEGDWEGKVTDIAKDAAEELKRLKRVSKRNIELADSSDDFSDSILPVVVEKVGQQVLKKVGDVKESFRAEPEKEGLEKIVEDVKDAAGRASAAVVGTKQPATESIASVASENIAGAASAASEEIYGTELNTAERAATALSEAILGTEEPTPLASTASSIASAATGAVRARVPGGVNAGFVGASRVEYEEDPDEETVSEKVQSFIDAANEKLADASRAVSEALAGATTTQAASEKYASIASEKYESALSAASSALYGTPQPAGESFASIATDKYSAAVAAASSVIYGTPTPKAELFASQASEAYERALTTAKDQYRKAMRNVATMVYPGNLSRKDSAKAAASEKYNEALTAAENTYSSLLKQASSVQSQYDRVMQQAQASYQSAVDAASTAIYGTPQPAAESVLSVAKEKYQQALKEAEKTYNSWYSVASTAVSPPPTPTVVIISSKLAEKAENAASVASEAVYGTPQPFTESVASVAGEYASAATDAAEDRYESVKAFVSELVSGKEPAYTESVMNRFSSLMYGTQAPIVAKATSAVNEAYDSASVIVLESYESATSLVGESYGSATSIFGESYGSATSAISSVMTPPPAVESIISAANEQYQAAITAASVQVYGTTQGTAESISSVVGEAYESAQSAISEAIYGRQTGAFESATLRMQEAAESAQRAISEAVYGTPKGTFESATSAFGEGVDTATSVIGETYAAATEAIAEGFDAAGSAIGESYEQAQARISAAIYGPQQGVVESAQSRISEAAESAKSSLSVAIYGTQAGYAEQAASSVSSAASVVSSIVEETVGDATEKVKEAYSTVKDEL